MMDKSWNIGYLQKYKTTCGDMFSFWLWKKSSEDVVEDVSSQ